MQHAASTMTGGVLRVMSRGGDGYCARYQHAMREEILRAGICDLLASFSFVGWLRPNTMSACRYLLVALLCWTATLGKNNCLSVCLSVCLSSPLIPSWLKYAIIIQPCYLNTVFGSDVYPLDLPTHQHKTPVITCNSISVLMLSCRQTARCAANTQLVLKGVYT